MATVTGKLQGFKSQFSVTLPGASVPVQFKSLQSFDIDVTAKEIDVSDHDSVGWGDHMTGMADWKGTVKGFYFEGDASQQGIFQALTTALTGDGDLACVFYPQKTAGSGGMTYTGTGTITSYKHADGGTNGAQALDITITGRGPLLMVAQS